MSKQTFVFEQHYIDNLVPVFQRRMFTDYESEKQCLWEAQMLCASHIARQRHIDWDDINELIEELSVEVKPTACLIVERAKKAGPWQMPDKMKELL